MELENGSSNWKQIDDNSNWNQLVIVPIIGVLTSPGYSKDL